MISIKNISKNLGEFFLKDVSLDVNDGEYLVILGPTGAGKTILLETIAGVYAPDSGDVYLNERNITKLPPRQRNIGMVYQDYMLFPHLTVRENIKYGLKLKDYGEEETEKRVKDLAELLNVGHLLERYPGTLSGGEQQRTAIARALIMDPEILLLDEPLSALDGKTRSKLREELRRVHSVTNTTIVHVTHSFDEAFLLGSQMAIMNKGEIIQVGEPSEVFRKPNSKFTAEFLGVSNIFKGKAVIDGEVSRVNAESLIITSSTLREGQVYVSVRPEDVIISLNPIESSARNSFKGKITELTDVGVVTMVTVDVGIPFTAAITRRSFVDMKLEIEREVYLTFKAIDVHVF